MNNKERHKLGSLVFSKMFGGLVVTKVISTQRLLNAKKLWIHPCLHASPHIPILVPC